MFFLTVEDLRAKRVPVMANSTPPENVSPGQPPELSPEKQLGTLHDSYIYRVLGDPEKAAALIRDIMGDEVAKVIDWTNFKQDPTRYVDKNLANHFGDLVFGTTLRGKPIRIRFLIEHSSYDKPYELLQALRYQVLQWEKDLSENKDLLDEPRRLIPMLTIVLHHSEKGWRGRLRFMDYFGFDEEQKALLGRYVVDFEVVLDDFSKASTEALLQRRVPPDVLIMLFALRHARKGREILDELPKLRATLMHILTLPNGKLVLGLFMVYITRVAKVSEAQVRTALQDLIESRLDPEMVALWTQFDAGEKKGRNEQGRAILEGLLTQRFGSLSPATKARLEAATLTELNAMTLRVLTAATVDEVLGK